MRDPRSLDAASHQTGTAAPWWRSAVIYQVYPRSFADSDGDGNGDLRGITSRLPYLCELGVDAVWISPFYPSPQVDGGYDVADYRDVDGRFGTLEDIDKLITRAHELGLRVLIDLVPNHTSNEHPWFQRALAAAPGSPARDWYYFRNEDPSDPAKPPNNWPSEFGGPAWSKTPDGQWYLHLFDSRQPDLNWAHPEVRAAFLEILRFWLDRGIDGFRIDVAHGLVKAAGLPDAPLTREQLQAPSIPTRLAPYWDQEGVHEIYREWRALLDEYPGDRAMVAEAWVRPEDRLARYVRPDEHHQAFNFSFLETPWKAEALRQRILEAYRANESVGAPSTWVLSNHDVIRHATRLALDPAHFTVQLGAPVPPPDRALGLRRARAASTLMLALPGSAYLYQGEELGLPEVLDFEASTRQDPTFHRTGGERLGRDGCRVPLPWKGGVPGAGFGPTAASWLPQPEHWSDYAVDKQQGRAESTLELYRSLLSLRRLRRLGEGTLTFVEHENNAVVCEVSSEIGKTRVMLNFGEQPLPIPTATTTLISSEVLVTAGVPTDTAVWLALDS